MRRAAKTNPRGRAIAYAGGRVRAICRALGLYLILIAGLPLVVLAAMMGMAGHVGDGILAAQKQRAEALLALVADEFAEDAAAAIASGGRLALSTWRPGPVAAAFIDADGGLLPAPGVADPRLAAALDNVAAERPLSGPVEVPATWFMALPGGVGLAALVPVPAEDGAPPRTALALGELTADRLAPFGAMTGFDDLTVTTAAPGPRSIAITGPNGIVGRLAWMTSASGARAFWSAFPGAGLAIAALLLLGLWWAWSWRVAAWELRRREEKASTLAYHDFLTGLPNRRAFMLRLAETSGTRTVLFVDLDNFKAVNDGFGHDAGDLLLSAIARRIADVLPEGATLARMGGDEFAVLAPAEAGPGMALAGTIVAAVSAPLPIIAAGHAKAEIRPEVSIGVASAGEEIPASELLGRADVAMYAAKGSGVSPTAWRQSMDRERETRRRLADDLLSGRGHFRVDYMPIVRSADGRLAGIEALARWRHPVEGDVPPAIFIALAEENGLLVEIGERVIREACTDALRWPELTLSVNLAPVQLRDPTIVERIAAILRETGFPAARLELEITEGGLTSRSGETFGTLAALRRLGVGLSLDDFGTGHAGIGYVQRFRLDRLKLDRSYVETIAADERSATIAAAVVALCRALEVPVTAEGVETEAQADLLRRAGCTYLQGWLFGRAGPPVAIDAMLREEQRGEAMIA